MNSAQEDAFQDFLPKLKEHLLDRVIQMIETDPSNVGATPAFELGSKPDAKHLFFKSDRLYRHNLLQVNYTTYDVRRKRDSINPRTSHRDVMVLSGEENSSAHPYLYARVIHIFHANIIYTGPGTTGYRPRRVEFLWVRWYTPDTRCTAGGWQNSTLDRIRFPPMADSGSFGFLDPADVVRAAHIVPAFAAKRRHDDRTGLSRCAKDSDDWNSYYVMR